MHCSCPHPIYDTKLGGRVCLTLRSQVGRFSDLSLSNVLLTSPGGACISTKISQVRCRLPIILIVTWVTEPFLVPFRRKNQQDRCYRNRSGQYPPH